METVSLTALKDTRATEEMMLWARKRSRAYNYVKCQREQHVTKASKSKEMRDA